MKIRRWLKRLLVVLAVCVVLVLGLVVVGVSKAQRVTTASGVDVSWRIPIHIGKLGSLVVPDYAGTGENVFIKNYLAGPVVRHEANGHWTAEWFCQNQVQHARGSDTSLAIDCAERKHVFNLAKAPIPPAVAAMPDKLVVLSDLEGNDRFLVAALRKLGIIDDAGRWRFGQGQLVILGDSVDRGRDVFAVLWRLHGLSIQAHAAGGAVHMVLGNHEQYLLRGKVRRTHPEYRYALQQLGGYEAAFAGDTELGAWLRQLPVALKLGSVLFVHGGVSPQTAQAGLTIKQLNNAMREYWRVNGTKVKRSTAFDAVLASTGVTQYRGYVYGIDSRYSKATQKEVESVLSQFGATQVVVGHTKMEKVTRLLGGLVYAVDVNSDRSSPDVLVYEHGVPHVVDLGIRRNLETEPDLKHKPFSLFDASDRAMFGALRQETKRLNAKPWPY